MSKVFSVLLLICFLLSLSSCGLKEGVVQSDSKSYLTFSGNTENATVVIDDKTPFALKRDDAIHYQITPGKHIIIVTKGDKVLVNREILLGNGATREITIP